MTDKLIIDANVLATFTELDHGVQICGPSGDAVGWFVPLSPHSDYNGYECPLPKEQLDAIEAAGQGRPLGEILASLEREN